MKKLIFILLTLGSLHGFSQGGWLRGNTSFGQRYYRSSNDSTNFIPTGITPSLRLGTSGSAANLHQGATFMDSANHKFWVYDPKRDAWDTVHMGVSGGSVDLSGYVTLHTRQTIDGDKLFSYNIDNTSSLGGFTIKTTGAASRYRFFADADNGLIMSQITDADSTISSGSALSIIGQNTGVLNLGRQGAAGSGTLGTVTFSSDGGFGTGVSNAYLRFNSNAGSPNYEGDLEYENRSFGIAMRVLADATLELRGATPLYLSGMSTGAGYVLTDVAGDGHYTSQPAPSSSTTLQQAITNGNQLSKTDTVDVNSHEFKFLNTLGLTVKNTQSGSLLFGNNFLQVLNTNAGFSNLGTLTSSTTGFQLQQTGGGKTSEIDMDSSKIKFDPADSSISTKKISYATNINGSLNANSLITKGYVDSAYSGGGSSLPSNQITFGTGLSTPLGSSPNFTWDSTGRQFTIRSTFGSSPVFHIYDPDGNEVYKMNPRGWTVMSPTGTSQIGLTINNPINNAHESFKVDGGSGGVSTSYGVMQGGITGTASETGMYFNNTATGGTNRNIFVTSSGSSLGGDLFVIGNITASTADIVIDGSGHVGIGTTAPTVPLQVAGDVKLGAGNSGLYTSGSQSVLGDWQGNNNIDVLVVDGGSDLAYVDNVSHSMFFGINTATPTVALDIVGNGQATGTIYAAQGFIEPVTDVDLSGGDYNATITGIFNLTNNTGTFFFPSASSFVGQSVTLNNSNASLSVNIDAAAGHIKYNGVNQSSVPAKVSWPVKSNGSDWIVQDATSIVLTGSYSPTLTNTTNVTSSTTSNATWARVGNVVSVDGSVSVVTTLAVATVLGISLPVASNLTATTDLNGLGNASSAIATNGYCEGDASNDRANLKFIGLSIGGSGVIYYHFSYTVQ